MVNQPRITKSQIEAEQIVQQSSADKNLVLEKLAARLLNSPYGDEDLLTTLYHLCEQLAGVADEYSAIVSDDASGRLVSLVVKQIMDNQRCKTNLSPLPIYFVAGGADNQVALEHFIDQHRKELQRPLFVTEFIASGLSIENLTKIFRSQGCKPDVASLSLSDLKSSYHRRRQFCQLGKLFYGTEDSYIGESLYDDKSLNYGGVTKKIGPRWSYHEAHPTRLTNTVQPTDQADIQKAVNKTRQDINLISAVFNHLL